LAAEGKAEEDNGNSYDNEFYGRKHGARVARRGSDLSRIIAARTTEAWAGGRR
jgi:hypothetical protein